MKNLFGVPYTLTCLTLMVDHLTVADVVGIMNNCKQLQKLSLPQVIRPGLNYNDWKCLHY